VQTQRRAAFSPSFLNNTRRPSLSQLINVVRAYLRAIETGDLTALLACYAPEAVQIEWPNRLKINGDRRTLEQLERDFERGRGLLARQSYEVLGYLEGETNVVVEVLWKGELAVPVGNLVAGDEMVVHSAMAFDFSDGRIVRQRNYDCFEPF
jgi:ketosteroid isomerase-like protein